jgi:aerobic-type carbon monoxide dehydrogenase small subunit (CoxS/CutS family)
VPISLHINGVVREVEVEPGQSLLFLLRDTLGLTGTKYGCAQDECAACTVLIDNRPDKSCRADPHSMIGRHITTIEGLEQDGQLHPVQEAFLAEQALQCGYCTAGMIMTAVGLLKAHPNPNRSEIVRYMQSNICRCGTYPRVIAAVQRAATHTGRANGGV